MALSAFCFNDETKKNSHGFFLLNAGGHFDRFGNNPVMLDNHDLDRLIGRWDDLHIEGTKLLAAPVFDEALPLGAERKGQVERGFMRGASPGVLPLRAEYRSNPTGGEDLYVTEWELVEGSLTSVPSNAGALNLRIYTAQDQPLTDKEVLCHLNNIIKLSAAGTGGSTKITQMDIIKLSAEAYVALGIKQEATAEAMSAAIIALHAAKTTAETALADIKAEQTKTLKANAEALVDLSIKEGRIAATVREDYITLAVANYALAKSTLEAIPVKVSLSAQVQQVSASTIPAERAGWSHIQWLKQDPAGLLKLKVDDRAAWAKITGVTE